MYRVETTERPKRYLIGHHWTSFRCFAASFETRHDALNAAMACRKLLPSPYGGRIKIIQTDE